MDVGFLLFCLDLIFMFFDSVVVIWGFLFVFPVVFCSIFINDSIDLGFLCVCLPRKFMGLKAEIWFAGDQFGCWVYGFGCFVGDLGLGLILCRFGFGVC